MGNFWNDAAKGFMPVFLQAQQLGVQRDTNRQTQAYNKLLAAQAGLSATPDNGSPESIKNREFYKSLIQQATLDLQTEDKPGLLRKLFMGNKPSTATTATIPTAINTTSTETLDTTPNEYEGLVSNPNALTETQKFNLNPARVQYINETFSNDPTLKTNIGDLAKDQGDQAKFFDAVKPFLASDEQKKILEFKMQKLQELRRLGEHANKDSVSPFRYETLNMGPISIPGGRVGLLKNVFRIKDSHNEQEVSDAYDKLKIIENKINELGNKETGFLRSTATLPNPSQPLSGFATDYQTELNDTITGINRDLKNLKGKGGYPDYNPELESTIKNPDIQKFLKYPTELKQSYWSPTLSTAGAIAGGVAAPILSGALSGGAFGSSVGPVGTAIGALAGAGLGYLGGTTIGDALDDNAPSRALDKAKTDAIQWINRLQQNPELIKKLPANALMQVDGMLQNLEKQIQPKQNKQTAKSINAINPTLVVETARKYSVPDNVAMSLVKQESGGSPTARSYMGAVGPTQLMPDTARAEGLRVDEQVDERLDPVKNIDAGLRHYSKQLKAYKGNVIEALFAYNGGYKAVNHFRKLRKQGITPEMAYQRIISKPGFDPNNPEHAKLWDYQTAKYAINIAKMSGLDLRNYGY